MRTHISLIVILALLFSTWTVSVSAHPPWERGEREHKHKKKHKKGRYKYKSKRYGYKEEYRDGNCKYKYKEGPRGYKEEIKCRRPRWAKGGPPPWAPAHGYRRKFKRRYEVKREETYAPPYGIGLGRCNRGEINSVLGGVAGGIIGSQIGKGDGKTVATIGGAIIGYLVGSAVGQDLDRLDHACVGQALEHGRTDKIVAWRNPDSGRSYEVTPTKIYKSDGGEYCREYTSVSTMGGRTQKVYGRACRRADGTWKLVN
jgi:surface antigen